MPPSKIECFINDTKKVFNLQICDSLLIHKGRNPWHTLYNVIQGRPQSTFWTFFLSVTAIFSVEIVQGR